MSVFNASVQYNDLRGTAAADRGDNLSLRAHLQEQGIIGSDDTLLGVRFGFHGNHGRPVEKPGIVVYVCKLAEVQSPSHIRAVELDMTIADLFMFFKRFDVVITDRGQSWPEEIVKHEYAD